MNRPSPARLNPRDATLERMASRRIEADGLIPPEVHMLVGVSGGADSVALLHFLVFERPGAGASGPISVAHVNHGLRGAASDEDAAFVRRLADAWKIPFFEARIATGTLGASEEQARRLRYDALKSLAAQAGADIVAVAHTADDQAETVLFRMARGAGLRGLAGMASERRFGARRLIRPILDVTREQVLAYIARHGLDFREDASNASLKPARNFVRHEILPRLRDRVNPAVRDSLIREAELFREADAYLAAEARKAIPGVARSVEPGKIVLEASLLLHYPKLLRFYIFRCALQDLDGVVRELTKAHIDVLHSLVTQSSGRSADLPAGVQARRVQGMIILSGQNREPAGHKVDPTLETSGVPADFRKGSPAE